jgi:hypothetical protein
LDYALALVTTNGLMPEGQQIALVRTLVKAGARVSYADMLSSLGHGQRAPAAWLVDNDVLALNGPIAAALGRTEALPSLLASGSRDEASDALAMAVINRQREAAQLCLEAGADPNRFMPCHTHSTAMHQAALHGDVETLRLLVAHGGRTDLEDTLWRGTPLGWALHGDQREATAYLRSLDLSLD